MIKLRKTSQRTPTSMLIEPPYQLNGSKFDPYEPRWRHLVYVVRPTFPSKHTYTALPSLCHVHGLF